MEPSATLIPTQNKQVGCEGNFYDYLPNIPAKAARKATGEAENSIFVIGAGQRQGHKLYIAKLKLKIDGVTKDSVVYGLNKYNNDDYDGLLGITCYDGYVAVRSSYKHFFNPKEIYIMVKK